MQTAFSVLSLIRTYAWFDEIQNFEDQPTNPSRLTNHSLHDLFISTRILRTGDWEVPSDQLYSFYVLLGVRRIIEVQGRIVFALSK